MNNAFLITLIAEGQRAGKGFLAIVEDAYMIGRDHGKTEGIDTARVVTGSSTDENDCQSCVAGRCTTGADCVVLSNPIGDQDD